MSEFQVEIEMACPVPTAFAYLSDPNNRPEWQSSLRSVRLHDEGEPRLGMRWSEMTMIGVRPEMTITAWEQDVFWAEVGVWAGVRGELDLSFAEVPGGTKVTADVRIIARGPWALAAWPAGQAGPIAVRSDLKRAAKILAERAASE